MTLFGKSKKYNQGQECQPPLLYGIPGTRGPLPTLQQERRKRMRAQDSPPKLNHNPALQRKGGVRGPLPPSQQLSRGEKILRDHLNQQEKEARDDRWRRRLFRKAVRWCQGRAPPPRHFIGKSSEEIADYLRARKISEEWIKAVISQIEQSRVEAGVCNGDMVDDSTSSEGSLWP
jgi:hypothetical protein